MYEAKEELRRIIQDREMKDALLLVFANKQDIAGGEYGMHSLLGNRKSALGRHAKGFV